MMLLPPIHNYSTALTETSMWKIVKMRCQVIYGMEEEEKQVSHSNQIFWKIKDLTNLHRNKSFLLLE